MALEPLVQGVKLIFTWGHINLTVAFQGPNVILGLYQCNYSLCRGKELGAATGQKQGAGPDSASRPCVCHLCFSGFFSPALHPLHSPTLTGHRDPPFLQGMGSQFSPPSIPTFPILLVI